MTLLAGDVGGTKTTLGVFDTADGPRNPIARVTVPSREYDSFEELCRGLLESTPSPVTHVSLGVPGPVSDGRAQTTNLPWIIDAAALTAEFGFRSVRLFNDLVAVAHGVPYLRGDELQTIVHATGDPRGPIAIVAPGTGLGQAFATRENDAVIAFPSEGGHVDFAPANTRQAQLLEYLWQTHEHVSYERVCSGLGIPNLYDFIAFQGVVPVLDRVERALASADDRTPIIVNAAQDPADPCPRCAASLELFTEILGAKAGNVALAGLTTGGVYLGGGIPPRLLGSLGAGPFREAFLAKGRLRPVMDSIPVRVILNPEAALFGAACKGLGDLEGPDFVSGTASPKTLSEDQ